MKQVIFAEEARKRIKQGVDTVANAVRVTMGHRGRAVLIRKGSPRWTLDGVTVAEAITEIPDTFKNMGATIVKNIARKTNDLAGDGTTTASVLTQAFFDGAYSGLNFKVDPIVMRRALEDGVKHVVTALKGMAREVKDTEEMKLVATISSREPEVGELIAGLYEDLGNDALITTEQVRNFVGIEKEVVDGMQVDAPYLKPHFITDFEKKQSIIEKPLILVTTQSINTNNDIVPFLELVLQTQSRSCVIIADRVQAEALATIITNRINGNIKPLVIEAPGFGDSKRAHLEDICAVTGATLITEETGMRVDTVDASQCGQADKVIGYHNRSVIIGGKGEKSALETRVKSLETDKANTDNPTKKLNIEKRIAKMRGKVAIIKIGAVTDDAAEERMYRVEDAVNAVRSANEEGVVPGGGLALYNASKVLDEHITATKDNSYRYGLELVRDAVRKPARQILENAGENPDVVLAQGYKVADEVIDPVKVPRVALELSSSSCGLFIITGAAIDDAADSNPKKKL